MFIQFYFVYVRHFQKHTAVFFGSFLAPRLASRPRQPLSSPKGRAGTACGVYFGCYTKCAAHTQTDHDVTFFRSCDQEKITKRLER